MVGLIGWLTPAKALITAIPGQPVIMPNTAISLILLGTAGALRRAEQPRPWQVGLSCAMAIVALIGGVASVYEYVSGVNLNLDPILIFSQMAPYPDRLLPPTGLALALLGAAILVLDMRIESRLRLPEWLSLAVALIALTELLGQLSGTSAFYRMRNASYIGMAVPAAIGVLAIAVGLLLERPESGVMKVITARGPGSGLLLRLAPLAILVPALDCIVAARLAETPGVGDVPLVFATLSVLSAMISLLLLAVTAVQLNRTHDALERSRTRTRELIDHASDGIFVTDLNGRYVDVNEAGCRMLGYERDEIIGKTIADLFSEDDVERLWAARGRLLKGENDIAEYTLRRKDGGLLPVEVSAKILPDGRWQSFFRDISERMRAEEALRRSEARLSAVVYTSADAIVFADAARRITLFNKGAETIYGRARAEMLGKPIDILVPERFREIFRDKFEQLVRGPDTAWRMGEVADRLVGARADGGDFPIDAAFSKISLGDEIVVTATVRDISVQARLENNVRALADMEWAVAPMAGFDETLTKIAERMALELADVCILDVEDGGSWLRTKVVCREPSQAWLAEALLQNKDKKKRRQRQATGTSAKPLLLQEATAAALASWAGDEDELKALMSTKPISAICVPMLARERCLGQILLLSSSRKYDSQDLDLAFALAARAAVAFDRALLYHTATHAIKVREEVLSVVAHDLRNPLHLIAYHAAQVRKLNVAGARELGQVIVSAAFRMSRLIEDLLDVARLEAGRLMLRPQRLLPREVIDDALETQAPLASEASLELTAIAAPDLPEIWGDQARLTQIFGNLIGNAINFTKQGGRILLAAQAGPQEITFSVSDTGTGIPEENLAHIFDRFWQGAKHPQQGAGLGLAIVKGLVEAQGGRVWVRSAPGEGTTVSFTIPLAPKAGAGQ
ncbi:MAG TPA: PAS domain S-box protein [Rhizomicrobium sp.]|nr:PAS domain S-box protein [Rhizomicrobium sp.]